MAVNVLLSYAFHADRDLAAVRKNLVCGRLMIDSGAFTADSVGKRIELRAYAEFLEQWRGSWNHAVTLDVIGDPVASRKQTRKLHDMGLPVMPVFTRGESIAEFDAMVRDARYVCVGGGVGMGREQIVRRVALLQRRAEELGGGIHALGVGAIPYLRRARPFSADVSNISGAFRFGYLSLFTGSQITRPMVSKRAVLAKYRQLILDHDIDAAAIMRAGRMPDNHAGRQQLMKAMSLSTVVADEWLRARVAAPAPEGVDDLPGPHLYSSLVPEFTVEPASSLDRDLHSGYRPRVWARYGASHVCRPHAGKGAPPPTPRRTT